MPPAQERHSSTTKPGALHYAALLGEDFSIPVLLSIGFSGGDLDAAFDDGELIEEPPGRAHFAEPASRQRYISELPWSGQRHARLELARAMQAHEAPCSLVVEQLLAAHAYAEARHLLVTSAEKASAAKDFRQALHCLQQALELWPQDAEPAERRRVVRQVARCARNCGQPEAERAAWKAFIAQSPGDNSAAERSEAYAALADLAQMDGQLLEVQNCLKASVADSDRSGDSALRAHRWMALALFHTDRLKMSDAAFAIGIASKAAGQAGDPVLLSEVIGVEGLIKSISDHPRQARQLVERSMEIALQTGQPESIALAHRRFANIADYASDFPAERDHHLKTISYCESIGEEHGARSCKSCLAYALMRTGDWPRALKVAEEVFNDKDASPELRDLAELMWSLIRAFRGELKTIAPRVDRLLFAVRRHGIVVAEFFALWLKALVEEQSGNSPSTSAAYEEIIAVWSDTEDRTGATMPLLFGATFFACEAKRTLLLTTLDALNLMSGDSENRERRGAARAARAELSSLDGAHQQACQFMAAAIADYQSIESMPERGILRWRYGELLAHAGLSTRANAQWEEADKLARRLGWRHLCGLVQASRDASLTPPSDAPANPQCASPLTERQCEVLSLIAGGLSNKEAAARLSLSPRTVEMHVARIIERLNCRTRTEAISRAAKAGWLQSL